MERNELDVNAGFVVERRRRRSNPMSLRQVKGAVRVFASSSGDRADWFCSPAEFRDPSSAGAHPIPGASTAPPAQRLAHGSTLNAGDCAYVFLEYPEYREPALEAAACASPDGSDAWAMWLEANNDPFAAPLRAMLAGTVFRGRERWWLEGCDRGMASVGATLELTNGFLRQVELRGGTLPIDLQVLHLLTLRVAQGLEELTVSLNGFIPASFWVPFSRSVFWEMAPWPTSLRILRLSPSSETKALELRQSAELIGPKLPSVVVEP